MPLSKITGNSFSASANTDIDNGLLFLNPTTNRVGVGITTPTAPFHAYTNAALNNTIAVFQNDISTPGYLGEVILSAPNRPAVRTNYRTSNDTNGFLNYDTGEFKLFANAGGSASEVLRANRYGIGLGSNSPSSGMGIMFPASQSASSDANTLDDYEEGTFTPTVSFGGTPSVGATYSVRVGTYTKIGRTVYFTCRVTLTNKGSSTGYSQISGLPFTVFNNLGSYGSASLGYSDGTTGWNVTFQTTLDTNQSYIYLRYNNGTTNVDLTHANWTNTTDCIWTGTYQTST